MTPPIEGMKVRPYGEDYMVGAFFGIVSFCLSNDGARGAFKKATGRDLDKSRSPIEVQIDQATGYDRDTLALFADWVAETEWGIEE